MPHFCALFCWLSSYTRATQHFHHFRRLMHSYLTKGEDMFTGKWNSARMGEMLILRIVRLLFHHSFLKMILDFTDDASL